MTVENSIDVNIVREWSANKPIQYRSPGNDWIDYSVETQVGTGCFPVLGWAEVEWRVKPQPHRFRVALMISYNGYCAKIVESMSDSILLVTSGEFVEWLTDWHEYIPPN